MSDVNKQLLDALKLVTLSEEDIELERSVAPEEYDKARNVISKADAMIIKELKGIEESCDHKNPELFTMIQEYGAAEHSQNDGLAIHLLSKIKEAIAAAEQAQQAQPVARDVLMAAMRQAVAECAEICDVYSAYSGARCASEIRHPVMEGKLADIADRYAAQPPAVAVPVLRDWPKLLEMARQIIRDGHVHDVGCGDLAVTTCEAFEGLDAFLKKNFPEPLGELTGEERKWLEAEAAIQPPFVPDGYALVRQEDLRKLKASINGEFYMGQAWEAETVSAMLAVQHGCVCCVA